MALRRCPQEAMTLNTCESPIVLALQERTASETIHLQSDGVLTLGHIVGDVELRRKIGVLAVSNSLTIHPKVITVSHAIETHVDVSVFPIGWDGELTTIRTHRVGHVTLVGEPTWAVSHHAVGVSVVGERILHIAIQRFVPILVVANTINLPAGRHIDVAPCCIVIIFLAHLCIHLAGVGHPVELPDTVQRLVIRRCGHVILCHILLATKRNSDGVCRLFIHIGYRDVVPFFTCLSIGCCNTHQTCHHCSTTHQSAKA